MKSKYERPIVPVTWIIYFLIVFEILYMITPFLALSYYSFYGPSLNFLNRSILTSWLTGFFLPHIAETTSPFLNAINPIGRYLFIGSFLVFLLGAAQIYYSKFAKKGAVTIGLYKYLRHPQYTMFAIMGLGLLLIWPRFIILQIYFLMLFVYFFLAKSEERECLKKYPGYDDYLKQTSMFFPGDHFLLNIIPEIRLSGIKRILAIMSIYLTGAILVTLLAVWIRSYSVQNLYTVIDEKSVTISVAAVEEESIQRALSIALSSDQVINELGNSYNDHTWLNYLVPSTWFLADLPLESYKEGYEGHMTPDDRDNRYKLLFTKAVGHAEMSGETIVMQTYRRIPVLVAVIDLKTNQVTDTFTPPEHVVWGNIPTPLF